MRAQTIWNNRRFKLCAEEMKGRSQRLHLSGHVTARTVLMLVGSMSTSIQALLAGSQTFAATLQANYQITSPCEVCRAHCKYHDLSAHLVQYQYVGCENCLHPWSAQMKQYLDMNCVGWRNAGNNAEGNSNVKNHFSIDRTLNYRGFLSLLENQETCDVKIGLLNINSIKYADNTAVQEFKSKWKQ